MIDLFYVFVENAARAICEWAERRRGSDERPIVEQVRDAWSSPKPKVQA